MINFTVIYALYGINRIDIVRSANVTKVLEHYKNFPNVVVKDIKESKIKNNIDNIIY